VLSALPILIVNVFVVVDVIVIVLVVVNERPFSVRLLAKRGTNGSTQVVEWKVNLTKSEPLELKKLVSSGRATARKLMRARILLEADEAKGRPAMQDEEIVKALDVYRGTIFNVDARKAIGPTLGETFRTTSTKTLRKSSWSWIISIFTDLPHSTRPLPRKRRGV
jgi:hypothetical protein